MDEPDLAAEIEGLWRGGRGHWPDLHVALERFASACDTKLRGQPASAARDILAGLSADELYLACACADGDTTAIRAFESRYFAIVGRVGRRSGAADALIADVEQQLRELLFVGRADEPARVIRYAGFGNLHGFVRVVAARLLARAAASPLARGMLALDGADAPGPRWEPVDPTGDLDLQHLRAAQRAAIKAALDRAVDELEPRERTLLRLVYVETVTLDAIARIYRVHRRTVIRWLVRARRKLRQSAREALAELLGSSLEGLDALDSALATQMSLSLERLFPAGSTPVGPRAPLP